MIRSLLWTTRAPLHWALWGDGMECTSELFCPRTKHCCWLRSAIEWHQLHRTSCQAHSSNQTKQRLVLKISVALSSHQFFKELKPFGVERPWLSVPRTVVGVMDVCSGDGGDWMLPSRTWRQVVLTEGKGCFHVP